ncbi:MAG: hypothetical protein PHP64_04920, partial [Actinomycetota bacterium]|nr:hypothetical protein [Actinomycetota bacterium]
FPTRPIPVRSRRGRAPARTAFPKIPAINIERISRIKDISTPRNIMSVVASILLIASLIFVFTGRNYFSKPEQITLESARKAFGSLTSIHVGAEIHIESEKKGAFLGNAAVDVLKNGDYRGTYSAFMPDDTITSEVTCVSGKAYRLGIDGSWETLSAEIPGAKFLTSSALSYVSGAKLLGEEIVDGSPTKHIVFTGSTNVALALFPEAEAASNPRTKVEVWIEPETGMVRHMRITATNLSFRRFGKFNLNADVGYSNPNSITEIKPPT